MLNVIDEKVIGNVIYFSSMNDLFMIGLLFNKDISKEVVEIRTKFIFLYL
jgi:hypothetical protein